MIRTVHDLPSPDRDILEKYQLLFIERLRVSELKKDAPSHRDDADALESVLCGIETLFLHLNDPNTDKPDQPFWNTNFIFGHLRQEAFNNLQAWQYMLRYMHGYGSQSSNLYAQTFLRAWRLLDVDYADYAKAINDPRFINPETRASASHTELYQYFIDALKILKKFEDVQQSISLWETAKEEEHKKISGYVHGCLDTCSPLWVTRIQLYYGDSPKETRKPEDILLALAAGIKKGLLAKSIKGFIASLDVESSIQLHLLLDGSVFSRLRKDSFSIGTLWEKIICKGNGYLTSVHESIELPEATPESINSGIFSKYAIKPERSQIIFGHITKDNPAALTHFINQVATTHAYNFLLRNGLSNNKSHIIFESIRSPTATPAKSLPAIINPLIAGLPDKKRVSVLETLFDDLGLNQVKYIPIFNFYNNLTLYLTPSLRLIAAIETFMMGLKHDARAPYEIITRHGVTEWKANPLGECMMAMGGLEVIQYRMSLFYGTGDINFSPHINIFFQALSRTLNERPPRAPEGTPAGKEPEGSDVLRGNYFVTKLREALQSSEIKKAMYTSVYNTDKKHNLACQYFSYLLKKYGDLTILAIDLFPNLSESDPNTLTKNASRLLTQYLKKSKGAETLSCCVGHMGRWEYSEACGLYARVIFFFEAKKLLPEKKEKLSMFIGNYWMVNITGGEGTIGLAKLSSHPSFHDLHMTQIRQSEKKLINDFKESVIAYLTQSTLYLKDKRILHRHIFLRGELPTKVQKKPKVPSLASHKAPPSDNSPSLTALQAMDPDL